MRLRQGLLVLGGMISLFQAADARAACDRACLRHEADRLLDSIVHHDPAGLPLTPVYRATENGVAAALPMMTIWQTAGAADDRFYAIDSENQQVFLLANVAEGAHRALLFGRIHRAAGGIDEVELYVDRSRSDGGFQFDATGLGHLPEAWTRPVAPARLLSRQDLLRAGRSIFDTRIDGPEPAAECRMMENGKPVAEDPRVLKVIGVGGPQLPPNPDGSVPIPCGAPPIRPTDPDARTVIVDEQQGIVVSIATVQGLVQPYLVTDPTLSAYVPDSLGQPYRDLLAAQRKSGDLGHRPELAPTPASISVAQMHRYYDGKLQGMHLLEKLGPPGAHSPWVAPNP
jgi:hypothetical protein